jgi:prepilin-type N-terminal cleavage/methylation domain-containing protein
MNKYNHKTKNGFSLIEVIVALFIISVGLVGMLGIIFQSIQAENVNENRLVASQLAQEGLELTRNVRDDNWLGSENWYHGISEPDSNLVKLRLDHKGNRSKINSIDEGALQINDEGYYVHNSAYPDSNFKRMIVVENKTDASSSVSCLVEWNERGRNNIYVADTILYNWR